MKTFSRTVGALALVSAAFSVQAASISYYLDQSNVLTDGVNYLQVTISDGATIGDIDFTVDVLSANFPGPLLSNFGMQTFSFNYDNSLSISTANIQDVDPATWNITEDANAGGGFGKFEFELSGTGATRTTLLTFTISGVTGDTLSSYAIGSTLNPSSGEFFAAHVADFAMTNGATSAQFAGSTPVPVPAALWLFGSGLLGLVGISRRKKTA
ncbi:MAG: VPLPA-CTERM sorting domain-containing protein [Thiohalobacteraceae bacterium]